MRRRFRRRARDTVPAAARTEAIRRAREAALSDPEGTALHAAIAHSRTTELPRVSSPEMAASSN
jgi:hypothetical protein